MKVFISWSGSLSKSVAEKLRPWMREIIQGLEPFVSSLDIQKGNLWLTELMNELEGSSIGIICLTKENLNSKWLLFEAGALFKKLGKSKICTLLINVTPLEMDLPLSAFQATLFQKDDVYKLIKSIYLSLDKQLLNEQELERQFNRCWPDIESQLKILLSSPFEGRNELQDLTEELLLPVIYRETNQGDLETVFEWLRIAKSKGVANLEGHLGFVEASLARITGKRQAPASLKQLSIQNTIYSSKAQLELLFYYFASEHRLSEVHINIELINNYPESIRRTCYAVLSLWNLHENNNEIAKWLFEKAEPNRITSNVADYYRSIPMGILCFAFGNGELGEKYFDLTRNILLNNEGYPFVSLLAPFDRKFINTCIGYEGDQDSEKRIRERIRDFRGHCWVLIKYADFLCENENALQSLISRTLLWKKPLTKESIVNKLKSLQKEFISFSGRPLLYQKEG